MGIVGTSRMVIDDSEIFTLDNLEPEVVAGHEFLPSTFP